MRKNRCKDSVQSPRCDALEGERPLLDRISLRALVREAPQELLDGPLVPLVELAVRIVDLLLRPHCELPVGVFFRAKLTDLGTLLEAPADTSFW